VLGNITSVVCLYTLLRLATKRSNQKSVETFFSNSDKTENETYKKRLATMSLSSVKTHRYCIEMKVGNRRLLRRKVKPHATRSLAAISNPSALETKLALVEESKERVRALPKPARAAFQKRGLWPNGSTLRIRFVNGTAAQQRFVQQTSAEWTKYANLTFQFVRGGKTDLRIAFDKGQGSWSYVGTDNLEIPQHTATMNLGWLDRAQPTDAGTVLHEFGHAIGLVHEHMRPGAFEWNRDAVIADLSGPPNYWDVETIEENVLSAYEAHELVSTEAIDQHSIMMYSYPSEWLIGSDGTPNNETLSDLDKQHAQMVYPGATGEAQAEYLAEIDDQGEHESAAESKNEDRIEQSKDDTTEEIADEWILPLKPTITDGQGDASVDNRDKSRFCSCFSLFPKRDRARK